MTNATTFDKSAWHGRWKRRGIVRVSEMEVRSQREDKLPLVSKGFYFSVCSAVAVAAGILEGLRSQHLHEVEE